MLRTVHSSDNAVDDISTLWEGEAPAEPKT
ncbi:MAG: hypothetical protein JWN70_4191, partial [Planctomycetaceae bacterium]|nr:hypothetical protein [Planctomycetaceae bacterium]